MEEWGKPGPRLRPRAEGVEKSSSKIVFADQFVFVAPRPNRSENRLRISSSPANSSSPPGRKGPKIVFEYRLRLLIRLRPLAEKVRKSSSNIVFANKFVFAPWPKRSENRLRKSSSPANSSSPPGRKDPKKHWFAFPPPGEKGPKIVFEYRLRQQIRLRPRAGRVRKSSSNIVFGTNFVFEYRLRQQICLRPASGGVQKSSSKIVFANPAKMTPPAPCQWFFEPLIIFYLQPTFKNRALARDVLKISLILRRFFLHSTRIM